MKYVRLLACITSVFYALIAQHVVAQQTTTLPATIEQENQDREYWTGILYKIVSPVIHNLASGTLKKNMPLGLPANDPFWTSKSEDWTTKKAWQGQAFKKDYKVGY